MIKVSEAVFHPDPSVVSEEDFSMRVAQMRQLLCQIQQSSYSVCESTSVNFRINKRDRRKSKRITGVRGMASSRIDHRK